MTQEQQKYLKQIIMLKFSLLTRNIITDEQLDTLLFGKEADKVAIVNDYITEKIIPVLKDEVSKIQTDYSALTDKQSELTKLNNLIK